MVAIPTTADAITADWLREAAPDARELDDLTSIRTERLGEGVGVTTEIYRLTLGYGDSARRGPQTLVAKIQASMPAMRDLANAYGFYEREVLFYREIASTIDLKSPRCLVAEFEPATSAFVIIMEDLSGATPGDQVAGLSLDQVRLAIGQVGQLHARWWERPELKALEGKVQPIGTPPYCDFSARHAVGWPTFDAWLAGKVSPELRRIGERLCSTLDEMARGAADGPRTLCHGDFRADNLMFTRGPGGQPDLTCVDWQIALQASGSYDIGYLMSGSVNSDLRREHEVALLREYHAGLERQGVVGYGFDACFHDYRRALLIGLSYVSQAFSAADLSHPRIDTLATAAVRRIDAAIHDLGLAEFVS